VTGYRVERSATATGSFATVGTSTTTTYTHQSAAAGQNCYRVIAISTTGESVPSNVACKTNVEPAGPPNPPTNVTIAATTVYEVRPNLQRFTFERGNILRGVSAKIGNGCDESRCVALGRDFETALGVARRDHDERRARDEGRSILVDVVEELDPRRVGRFPDELFDFAFGLDEPGVGHGVSLLKSARLALPGAEGQPLREVSSSACRMHERRAVRRER
jgi:hypothetical protein